MSQLEPASWLTECVKAASFPKLQPPSDRTKPTFEKKGTQPEALSTLTETSYMVAQLRPNRERKKREEPREGENRVEKAHGKNQTRERESRKDKGQKKAEEPQNNIEKEGMQREAQASQEKDVEQTEGASKPARAHIRKARTKARHP